MAIQPLKPGDTIGIITPAFNTKANIQNMEEEITQRGYKIKYAKNYNKTNGYLAGTDQERIDDIEEMFSDEEVKVIIAMLGGFGTTRIVDKINYDVIRKNPKLLCGFSDITVLLNTIYQKTNIPSIHGLIALQIGNSHFNGQTKEIFWNTFEKEIEGTVLENPNQDAKTLVSGKATGPLVGGNLSLLRALAGSEYEVDFTDKIIFIEEVSEDPYRLDGAFATLRLTKQLAKAKGFVFGYFTDCLPRSSRPDTQTYIDIIKDYILPLNKPTIYDFACGHDFPFLTLPIGLNVELDADNKTITILEKLYKE